MYLGRHWSALGRITDDSPYPHLICVSLVHRGKTSGLDRVGSEKGGKLYRGYFPAGAEETRKKSTKRQAARTHSYTSIFSILKTTILENCGLIQV